MSLLFTVVFTGVVTAVALAVQRRKLTGISKKLRWHIDLTNAPEGGDIVQVECGKTGNVYHKGPDVPPGCVRLYEPTGKLSKGYRKMRTYEENDVIQIDLFKNSQATHPMFRGPFTVAGLSNIQNELLKQIKRLKASFEDLEEEISVMRERYHEAEYDHEEAFNRMVKKVEKAKDAASYHTSENKRRSN